MTTAQIDIVFGGNLPPKKIVEKKLKGRIFGCLLDCLAIGAMARDVVVMAAGIQDATLFKHHVFFIPIFNVFLDLCFQKLLFFFCKACISAKKFFRSSVVEPYHCVIPSGFGQKMMRLHLLIVAYKSNHQHCTV
jgi:hypothetical protein